MSPDPSSLFDHCFSKPYFKLSEVDILVWLADAETCHVCCPLPSLILAKSHYWSFTLSSACCSSAFIFCCPAAKSQLPALGEDRLSLPDFAAFLPPCWDEVVTESPGKWKATFGALTVVVQVSLMETWKPLKPHFRLSVGCFTFSTLLRCFTFIKKRSSEEF